MRISRFALIAATAVAAAGCSSDSTTAPSIQNIHPGLPTGWSAVGTNTLTYVLGLDNATVHGGHAALSMAGSDTNRARFIGVGQFLSAANYLGKRIRFSAFVRVTNAQGADIGLWMRVDGVGVTEGFDNFSTRPLLGTTGWQQVEIILDIPNDAVGIAFGALMSGSGQFSVDDMKFEVIPASGQTTNLLSGNTPIDSDPSAFYATRPKAPTNLDFEQ
ncbi:MAG: transcriptional regulator [Gemmatimonadetes bacterium]|nr:transcriptional regulator [Gemmatimonadota bacterium]